MKIYLKEGQHINIFGSNGKLIFSTDEKSIAKIITTATGIIIAENQLTAEQKTKLYECLSLTSGMGFKYIQPNSCLRNDLCLDSLDLVDLSFKLEGEFGIRELDTYLEDINTVEGLEKTVANLINQ